HLIKGNVFAGEFQITSLEGEEKIRKFDEETGLSLWG
ncbi:DNA-binding protein, partial [bacterium B13(2017)]